MAEEVEVEVVEEAKEVDVELAVLDVVVAEGMVVEEEEVSVYICSKALDFLHNFLYYKVVGAEEKISEEEVEAVEEGMITAVEEEGEMAAAEDEVQKVAEEVDVEDLHRYQERIGKWAKLNRSEPCYELLE